MDSENVVGLNSCEVIGRLDPAQNIDKTIEELEEYFDLIEINDSIKEMNANLLDVGLPVERGNEEESKKAISMLREYCERIHSHIMRMSIIKQWLN